uniref:Uncharacterized protein n=1 Tax=Rhizophora mucronata TaxID=61149 RepID=A0A2P2PC42_RHIMU
MDPAIIKLTRCCEG